jgi:hypothetical protein
MAHGTEINQTDMTPEGLIGLARRLAEEQRRESRALTASLQGGRDAGLTDRQRATLSRLLRQLISETDADIRGRALAANEDDAVLNLPAPVEAEPTYAVMVESGAFEDGALVDAVLHRLYQHQLERAVRAPAPGGWLGDSGEADHDLAAILGVAEGGSLWRLIGEYQVECSGRTDSYGEPTLLACDLATGTRARLYWDCAASVRETLSVGDGRAAPEIDVFIEVATRAALASDDRANTRTAALALGLLDEGRLSADVLVPVLRAGEVALFESGLGILTGLGPRILRDLLYAAGGEALAIMWRALQFPDPLFNEIYALSRHALGRPQADPSPVLERLHDFRARMPVESARAVLGFWRLSPDYHAARGRVENRHRATDAEGWG